MHNAPIDRPLERLDRLLGSRAGQASAGSDTGPAVGQGALRWVRIEQRVREWEEQCRGEALTPAVPPGKIPARAGAKAPHARGRPRPAGFGRFRPQPTAKSDPRAAGEGGTTLLGADIGTRAGEAASMQADAGKVDARPCAARPLSAPSTPAATIPRKVGSRRLGVTPDVDFDRASERDMAVRGERALWRAVILQALADASSHSKKYEAELERGKARRWLLAGSRDFVIACEYADFDPGYVHRHARRALAGGCVWRLPPNAASRAFQKR